MLDYRRDRLDYGQALIPPPGCSLERAVAATYSVDLNTLLSIPVALIYAQTLEGHLDGERFQILEAIQAISKKVTVYHQKGQLHVPTKYNRLYAFLEDMLIPVQPATAFTSFHPKVWVLRYASDDHDRCIYRVLVLSRNLTYDRSWDIGIAMDGVETYDVQDRNKPLVDFLRHLDQQEHTFEGASLFLSGLERAEFDPPEGFRRPVFHPIGIPGYYTGPIHSAAGDAAAVMSPFVDAAGVKTVRDNVDGEFYLFSRHEELTKETAATLSSCTECYAISNWVVDGERQIEQEGSATETREQDLHAKVYVYEENGRTRWFVGSANATKAALTRNTEFLVELTRKPGRGNLDDLLDELLGPERDLGVFEVFDPEDAIEHDPDRTVRDDVRETEYALLNAPVSARLAQAENETNFDLTVLIDCAAILIPEGMTVSVAPLSTQADTRKMAAGTMNELVFQNIQETQLSRFLVYTLTVAGEVRRRFLVRVDIDGLPDTRRDSIFRSIVSSPEKFFEYLRFLLAEEYAKEDLTQEEKTGPGDGRTDDSGWRFDTPVFEQLLIAASRDPHRLQRVDALIGRLRREQTEDDPIVPAAFVDFWDVFRSVMPTDAESKR